MLTDQRTEVTEKSCKWLTNLLIVNWVPKVFWVVEENVLTIYFPYRNGGNEIEICNKKEIHWWQVVPKFLDCHNFNNEDYHKLLTVNLILW